MNPDTHRTQCFALEVSRGTEVPRPYEKSDRARARAGERERAQESTREEHTLLLSGGPYRGTSLIRKRPPRWDPPWTLGIGLQ
jgi:hypothetical protein